MAGFTTTTQAAIANWVRGTAMPTPPAALFLALSTQDIADDGSGFVEPTGGYSRQPVTMTAPSYVPGVGTVIRNAVALVFGPSTSAWGAVRAAALVDGSGNIILKGSFAAPKNFPTDDTASFAIGAVEFVVR